ncbi:MAG TPA: NAD-binding protein [Streptosporangiaceae bacterium]|jgi:Trk K+ transport system NAD-binding subunit|nr:NAD-binding protein [Streptosporangiaceae bacterium]
MRQRGRRDHLVVCGSDSLALRMVEELAVRYGEQVTVILRSAERGHGPRIARLPGVRVVERAETDRQAFLEADLPSARSLALLDQDDLGNFHAALRAQELNPDLRLVISIFNTSLGERIRTFFADCAVLSESAMAAPSFVAAALGEPAPSHVRLSGRTLYVARREEVDDLHVVCGLAASDDSSQPDLTAPQATRAGLVLAVADGAPRDPLAQRRRPLSRALAMTRWLHSPTIIAFLALFAVLIVGFGVLVAGSHFSGANSLYLTLLDAAGAAVSQPSYSWPEKIAQVVLTFDGMAFLPLVTAAIVGARLTGSVRGPDRPLSDHVIVAGLGSVGTRIAGLLHDLGVGVVCVDKSEHASGLAMARRLGLRVVIGETHREETLRAAGIDTCQAVVSVTNSDIVNLETALHARGLAEVPRVVVRLLDDDLARRVQETVSNTISRSVSYLAAPVFAAAMLDHQVLRTIAVGRHVLMIADVPVSPGAELVGWAVGHIHDRATARVIALRTRGAHQVDWSPRQDYRLAEQDRIFVLATRAGLSAVLRRAAAPQDPAPAPAAP